MSKLLKILFVVLLVVTVAEAGYYVYMLKKTKSPYTQFTQIDITPTSVPTDNDAAIRNIQARQSMIADGTIISSIRTNTFYTTIQAIDFDQINKQLMLTIKSGKTSVQSLVYKGDTLDRISTFQLVEDKENPIPLSNLRIGDKIRMEMQFDELNKSHEIFALKIVKI